MSSPAKTLKYSQNGTGRDSYIYSNNGGYYPCIPSVVTVDTGKFVSRTHRPSSAHKWSRPKKYTTNGSGRDLYVVGEPSSRSNFLRTLRSRDSALPTARHSTPKKTVEETQKQFLATWRLSQPKQRNPGEQYLTQMSQNYNSRQTTKNNFYPASNPEIIRRSSSKHS